MQQKTPCFLSMVMTISNLTFGDIKEHTYHPQLLWKEWPSSHNPIKLPGRRSTLTHKMAMKPFYVSSQHSPQAMLFLYGILICFTFQSHVSEAGTVVRQTNTEFDLSGNILWHFSMKERSMTTRVEIEHNEDDFLEK